MATGVMGAARVSWVSVWEAGKKVKAQTEWFPKVTFHSHLYSHPILCPLDPQGHSRES